VAQLAADRGYNVAVNFASDHDAAERVVAGCRNVGVNALACRGDMAIEAEVLRVFDEAAALGPLTHVVNNAGITGRASRLDAASSETIRACIDLTSSARCSWRGKRRASCRGGTAAGVAQL
jgi:NAD(P)-dependent dehydrogenase (short-subunit alcohol dehydrogenase family)